MVVGPVGAFRDHDVGSYAGQIRLIGEGEQIEHQFHLLREVFQFPNGSLRNLEGGKILSTGLLRAPLDFANAFQIPVKNGAVAVSELTLEPFGAVENQVQNATSLV